MSQFEHGQSHGRAERINQTCNWLGAKPMTNDGRPVHGPEDSPGVDYATVVDTAQRVRTMLEQGIRKVVISERDSQVRELIRQLLLPDELENVEFAPHSQPNDILPTVVNSAE